MLCRIRNTPHRRARTSVSCTFLRPPAVALRLPLSSRLSNPWRGLRGLPPHVWVVCGTMLINRVGTMVLPFLALYLTQRLAMPPSRAGLVSRPPSAGGSATASAPCA
jgi:hypothetical protein